MSYCGFDEDSCAPMCRFVGMVCGAKGIARDDEVGFGNCAICNEELRNEC